MRKSALCLCAAVVGAIPALGSAAAIYDAQGFENFNVGNLVPQDSWTKWGTATGAGGSIVSTYTVLGNKAMGGGGATGGLRSLSSFSFNQASDVDTDLIVQFTLGTTQQKTLVPTQTSDYGLFACGLTTKTAWISGGNWDVFEIKRQSYNNTSTPPGAQRLAYTNRYGANVEGFRATVDPMNTFYSSVVIDSTTSQVSSDFINMDVRVRYLTGANNDRIKVSYQVGTLTRLMDTTVPATPVEISRTYSYGAWQDINIGVNDMSIPVAADAAGFFPLLGASAAQVDAPSSSLYFGAWWGQNAQTANTNGQRLDDLLITTQLVPEPAAMGLLTAAGLMALRRRRAS